jgi:hypothetical protein
MVNPANGHTYQRIDAPQTWVNAKGACASQGGHLATLTSAEEDSWLWNNLGVSGQDIWLGGTDEVTEGVWQWITGEPWSYTNWGPGEPDNGAIGQNDLIYWSAYPSQWGDYGAPTQADDAIPYICEWDTKIRIYSQLTVLPVDRDGHVRYVLLGPYGSDYMLFVIDGHTRKIMKQIKVQSTGGYSAGSPTVVPDVNNNGHDGIAVLLTNTVDGSSTVNVYDSVTGKTLTTLALPK